MKVQAQFQGSRRSAPAESRIAFTLPELLITLTLFLLLVGGIVSAHLFGLRMSRVAESKLSASDSAREALGKVTDEVRNCASTWIGDVSNGVFVAILDGMPQSGSALLIQPMTNSTNFIVYFANPSDQSFRRTTSVPGTTTILAQTITNTTIFSAQDYVGNLLTNNQSDCVIHLSLEFFQSQPLLPVDNYYKLETAVTRRVLD
jgi:type II secretory pathway pseudopilin PulG